MNQHDKTKRLQTWILDNTEDWYTICGMGEPQIPEEEFMRLWRLLTDSDFHELTLVLLTCHFASVEARVAANINDLLDRLEDMGADTLH